MATIREYFDTDPRSLTLHGEWNISDTRGSELGSIIAKIAYDFVGNARYWFFYVPQGSDSSAIPLILDSPETNACILKSDGDGILAEMTFSDLNEGMRSDTLVFTKRIFIYIDELLDAASKAQVMKLGQQRGFHVVVRDRQYAMKRSEYEKPLAFICHDSRDKDDLVRGLAYALMNMMCPVWYDEFSLKVGDSLRAKIEDGLKSSRKCVIVLSPHFLSNEGWTKAEFDSVFTREILEKNNVMLPIWHNVSKEAVYNYSPRLADKVGLSSSIGIEALAKKLVTAIRDAAI